MMKWFKAVMLFLMGFAVLTFFPQTVFADDSNDENRKLETIEEIVVTASRVETLLDESTKSIDIVPARERDERQDYFLPEMMDKKPGVILLRNGGPGQFSNISIRGAGFQHTQYQYNGIPMKDAADTQSTLQYFIGDMFSGSNLDRVEVLKGTNSTLYGSQAMGGVVNIIPKKWDRGLEGEARSEIGPNGLYQGNARIAYGSGDYYVDFNPMYITTDGEDFDTQNGFYYDNFGMTFGAGIKPSAGASLEFSGFFSDSDLALSTASPKLDAEGHVLKQMADPDKHRESGMFQLGLIWSQFLSDKWDYTIKGSYGETKRHYFWSAAGGDQSNYDGETTYIEMQHNIYVFDWMTVNAGIDYERNVYDGREPMNPYAGDYRVVNYDESRGGWDAFTQAQFFNSDRNLFITMGGRLNHSDEFDEKAVWEASAAYLVKSSKTKFHAQVGTGYRTPSLYEIYGGYLYNGSLITIGNPDLTPEESFGFEFGVEQKLLHDKIKLGATYFFTGFDDLIIYDGFVNRYANATEAEISGVEAFISIKPNDTAKLEFAYTFTDSKYKENKDAAEWIRKEYLPENKLDIIATLYPCDKLTLSFDFSWQDEKIVPLYDPSYTKVRWEEKAVATVNLAATYRVMEHVDVFVRADNVLDESYTESGYTMPGRQFFCGAKIYF